MRRFDGRSRRTTDWDGLRKVFFLHACHAFYGQHILTSTQDSQLWFDEADCLVHFYAHRTSQRSASLRVPFEAIQKLDSPQLTRFCLQSSPPGSTYRDERDGTAPSALSTISELESATYNLYIPTPASLSRQEAYSYHLTTRNVIAYAVGKPVVGERLSTALLDLWKRLREWLPRQALRQQFISYLDHQGYLSFAENAEHALACLKLAEEARFRDVWINAFAHCAGMHERLDLSPEFAGLSKTTAALMTRASLEMDLHITRVMKALGGFLEEELGPENLGLSKPARDHLDHFRSFLHAYYVDKLGWFPPPRRRVWKKRPWRDMQEDFQRLYDYLVDRESTADWTSNRATNGGICVFQNIQAFDERHGYKPLPHPLALLPRQPNMARRRSITSQSALRNLKLGRSNSNSAPEAKLTPYQALALATNNLTGRKLDSPLIQQYQQFEHQKLDAKLDIGEARKVRWLLIYGVLQMLISITEGPSDVRDAQLASYPVCVLTTGCPVPDMDESDQDEDSDESDSLHSTPKGALMPDALDTLEGRSSRISIHPDCEADGPEYFFASSPVSRQESTTSLNQMWSSNRAAPPLSRTGSFRNSMQVFQKSFVGSLNKKGSRRNSLPVEMPKAVSYCEIVVEDYGNGLALRGDEEATRPTTAIPAEAEQSERSPNPLHQFDFDFAAPSGETVLDHLQLAVETDGLQTPHHTDASPGGSFVSTTSEENLDSNRSSYVNDNESMTTDPTSWEGSEASKRDSITSIDKALENHHYHQAKNTSTQPQHFYSHNNQNIAMPSNVTAGCYTPTGFIKPPVSKLSRPSHVRHFSGESITSNATSGSEYGDENAQAADIPEVDGRGRRQSRALDSFVQQKDFSRRFTMY